MRFGSTFPERRQRSRTHCAAATAAALAVWVVHAPAQTVFRGETNLVALQVTVVDQQRRYVPDLRLEDFSVFEDGQPQAVSLFAAGTTPLDLMLLLDTSASMVGILEIAQRAAVNFARRLGPDDRAGVILINEQVRVAHPLTNNAADLERALEQAPIAGGTALWDALYVALNEFTRGRADYRMRRQAIIVFTDGEDNASHVTVEDVLVLARGSPVMIYTVVPVRDSRSSGNRSLARALFDTRRLAEESGGRAFKPERLEDLAGAYDEITKELSHQYWLAYAPMTSTGGFKRVAVRIAAKPLLNARTRTGYYASGPRSWTSTTHTPRGRP